MTNQCFPFFGSHALSCFPYLVAAATLRGQRPIRDATSSAVLAGMRFVLPRHDHGPERLGRVPTGGDHRVARASAPKSVLVR